MKIKARDFSKYFLAILFIVYYVSITLFYHSHIINGVTVSHSHFYWTHTDSNGKPVNHSHSQDEYIFIKIITQFITTAVSGFIIFRMFLMVLNQYQIPLKEFVFSAYNRPGYSLRAPPLFMPFQ